MRTGDPAGDQHAGGGSWPRTIPARPQPAPRRQNRDLEASGVEHQLRVGERAARPPREPLQCRRRSRPSRRRATGTWSASSTSRPAAAANSQDHQHQPDHDEHAGGHQQRQHALQRQVLASWPRLAAAYAAGTSRVVVRSVIPILVGPQDSNLQPRDYESPAPPLSYGPARNRVRPQQRSWTAADLPQG